MADGYKISATDRRKINALVRKLDAEGYGRDASKYAVDTWLIRTRQMPGYAPPLDWEDPYIKYGIVKPDDEGAETPRLSDEGREKAWELWLKIAPADGDLESWNYAIDAWLVHIGQLPCDKFGEDWKDPYIEYGIDKPENS